jgi:hypothetical protein
VSSLPNIELVYDADCPNVERARSAIRAALHAVGAPEHWQEWERGAPHTPAALRHLGSPSVVVDGRDVGCDEGAAEGAALTAEASACRVYLDEQGCLCGAPSAQLIVHALEARRA